jgi:glutathione S-transferase
MIRLYGTSMSRANRCLWVLEELGLSYEHVPVGFSGESKTADYLHINPNGRVPALEDDGQILWESIAINFYLADKYGSDPFWPRNVELRGQCYKWSLWAVNEIEPRVSAIMLHRVWNPPERRDADIARRSFDDLIGPLRILDQHLSNRQFLLGDRFTLADVNVASISRALFLTLKMDLSESPVVESWFKKCVGRETYQRVLAMK